jgi:SAM-dependent methyltransferase
LTVVDTIDVACNMCGSTEYQPIATTRDFCYSTCENEFNYVRCRQCRHTFLHNRPVVAALGTIYPNLYLTYSYKEYLGGFINSIRDAFQKKRLGPISRYAKSGDAVLDIGCGGGDLLSLIARFGDPSWQPWGIDFSENAVKGLGARKINGIQARFEELEWSGPEVGVILMMQLIEHVEAPKASLAKAYELLRPGGVLVMETPTLDSWDSRLFRSRYWGGWHAPRHWSIFTEETLGNAARECGFEIAEVNYTLCPFLWLHSLQYVIRERLGWERIARQLDVDRFISLCAAASLDVLQKVLHRKTGNMQMIVQKPLTLGK